MQRQESHLEMEPYESPWATCLTAKIGWRGRDRTFDIRINSATLLPLSYSPKVLNCLGGSNGMHRANVDPPKRKVVGEVGIEPTVTPKGADLQSAVTQPIVTSLQ